MAKALFEEIFDGSDSLFGRIFGSSAQPKRGNKEPKIIGITLTPEQLQELSAGKLLTFKVGDDIQIRVIHKEFKM